MTMLQDYKPGQYLGLDREAASRRAQEVCAIAAETGQTLLALDHLRALAPFLKRPALINHE